MEKYDDDYATCSRTWATLRIYHDDLIPQRISERLELIPTSSQRKGEPLNPPASGIAPMGAWFLRTREFVVSKDVRRHVDWILTQLEGRDETIRSLLSEGYRVEISCYWGSAYGHGGPMVSPPTMARLGELGIELQFDIYFEGEPEST